MNKNSIMRFAWLIPALYVAYMFGNKIGEGLGHSEEFAAIISVIPLMKPFADTLTPLVGIWDFCIGIALILNPFVTGSKLIQRCLLVWVILWPFVPASLRYFGGVGEFEIVEVISISLAAAASFTLWIKYSE